MEKATSLSCVPSLQASCVSLFWLDWEYWEVFVLCCSGEASPGMLCPVLSSSVQEENRHIGKEGYGGLVLVELMPGTVIPD